MSNAPLKIGLLAGREWSMPPAFIEEINSRDVGVTAEFAKIGGTRMDEPVPYRVLIDRISHEIPYYRTYLKHALIKGTICINNPFQWEADDKFIDGTLATQLGVAHPRSVVLPNKDYVEGIISESLRNLVYPLDWKAIGDYVGFPAYLKDVKGGGWKEVYRVNSPDELIWRYDQSGRLTMVVQEGIEWDRYIRCMCLGREHVFVMRYDPRIRRYFWDEGYLEPELYERIVKDTLKLCRALGYDMNTCEWAIRDGIPYAIDFMNPAPDMDVYSLTPFYFDKIIKCLADVAIRLAKSGAQQGRSYSWWQEIHKGGG